MNFKDQLKQDFDNVFLHDFADVRIGDVLSFDRNSYVVNGVSVADGALLLCSNPNRSHTVS